MNDMFADWDLLNTIFNLAPQGFTTLPILMDTRMSLTRLRT
jgi:hypothetical protein